MVEASTLRYEYTCKPVIWQEAEWYDCRCKSTVLTFTYIYLREDFAKQNSFVHTVKKLLSSDDNLKLMHECFKYTQLLKDLEP